MWHIPWEILRTFWDLWKNHQHNDFVINIFDMSPTYHCHQRHYHLSAWIFETRILKIWISISILIHYANHAHAFTVTYAWNSSVLESFWTVLTRSETFVHSSNTCPTLIFWLICIYFRFISDFYPIIFGFFRMKLLLNLNQAWDFNFMKLN